MMTYPEALAFIHGIARFGSKPGLRRVQLLLERLGNPQDKLRFVHVAGTKGKGSTCAMLSNILKKAGLQTGLYISPFVLDFRERIQINGEMISENDLAEITGLVKLHWDELDRLGETPSEFELVVAVAMVYFLRSACDIVVLEVGMGGRLDATNVIKTPLCSVITSLGLDHTEYLGETIEEISLEKCGIIKPGGVTVSASGQPEAAAKVIEATCSRLDNRLAVCVEAEVLDMDITGSRIIYGGLELYIPLGGAHQIINAANAVEAVFVLRRAGLDINDEDISGGMSNASFPSRLEVLGRDPLILLDGAHNPMSARALAEALKLLYGRDIHAVVGIMADKDVRAVLSEVLPLCRSLTAVTPENPRAMRASTLAEVAREYLDDVSVAKSMEQALRISLGKSGSAGAVLIFGSLYLAAEIRPAVLRAVGR